MLQKNIRRVLSARNLLRVMSAQSLSTYANQVISFVIPWLVLTRTGSALNAGTVAFAMGTAMLLGSLLGGLIIDRIGGRKVSVLADSLSLITALGLGLALFTDYFSLWLVIVSQILGVFFDGPGNIAKSTTVPAAATDDNVPIIRATSLMQTLQQIAMFVGPLSAGLLVGWLTESVTLMAASAVFLLCIMLMLGVKKQEMAPAEHRLTLGRAYKEMREVVVFIIKEPFLGPNMLFGPLYMFILGPLAAIVVPAWFVFGNKGAESLGLFLAAQAIGGIIGGLSFAVVAPKISQRMWVTCSAVANALAILSLVLSEPGSIAAIVSSFMVGLTFAGILPIFYSAFFTRTPQEYLGRAGSIGVASGSLIGALASLFFGWLVSATAPTTAIVVAACGMGALAVLSMCLPFMRLLDEKKA